MIDIHKISAIDIQPHAEVSCIQPHDDYRPELDAAFAKYFKSDKRPTMRRLQIIIDRSRWRWSCLL